VVLPESFDLDPLRVWMVIASLDVVAHPIGWDNPQGRERSFMLVASVNTRTDYRRTFVIDKVRKAVMAMTP
jgi:hypothetical protein